MEENENNFRPLTVSGRSRNIKAIRVNTLCKYCILTQIWKSRGKKAFALAKENLDIITANIPYDITDKDIQEARQVYNSYLLQKRTERQKLLALRRENIRNEVIQEWIKIRQLLGRIPNSYDINKLRKQKVIKYSYRTYVNYFGDGKSFENARETLEHIIAEREATSSTPESPLVNPENQVFP